MRNIQLVVIIMICMLLASSGESKSFEKFSFGSTLDEIQDNMKSNNYEVEVF